MQSYTTQLFTTCVKTIITEGRLKFECGMTKTMTLITAPVSLLYTKVWLALKARVHGPFPVYSRHAKNNKTCAGGVLAQARAAWDEVGALLPRERWYVTLFMRVRIW